MEIIFLEFYLEGFFFNITAMFYQPNVYNS